jgi:CheY-like chemotaxis protein
MVDQTVEVLLVEDNPNDVELTMRVFRKNHLANRIHIVRDGEEALEYLFRTGQYAELPNSRPKVVLLDLKLPKVDGIEVLRQIRADAHLHDLPVVVMTSSREERDVIETYDLGVNSYIVKPVDFEQFTETVRQIGYYWIILNVPPHLKD